MMIFQRYGNMKFAYRSREFWCKGYYVSTSCEDIKVIKEYIVNQLKRDKEMDQLVLFDPKNHLWVASNLSMAGRTRKSALVRRF